MAENVQTVKVEYRDDKKIVTHPNGVVSEYPRAVLESFKQQMVKQRQMFEDQIVAVDKDLAEIDAAKVPAAPVAPVAPAEPAPAAPEQESAPAQPAASTDSAAPSEPAQGSENAG